MGLKVCWYVSSAVGSDRLIKMFPDFFDEYHSDVNNIIDYNDPEYIEQSCIVMTKWIREKFNTTRITVFTYPKSYSRHGLDYFIGIKYGTKTYNDEWFYNNESIDIEYEDDILTKIMMNELTSEILDLIQKSGNTIIYDWRNEYCCETPHSHYLVETH